MTTSKFEDEPASGITESASKALTKAEEFGDVICARVGTKTRGGGGGWCCPANPGLPPNGAPGAREDLLRVEGQSAISLVESCELWEGLRGRDTSIATLPLGGRATAQQKRVLDATNEKFG